MTLSPPRLERLPDDNTVLHLEGDITVEFLAAYKDSCLLACEGGRVVLDLTGCHHLDSSGLGLLVSMNRKQKAAGGDVAITNVPAHLHQLFEKTRLLDLFVVI